MSVLPERLIRAVVLAQANTPWVEPVSLAVLES
jgi:chorismate-pyruvate lyase